VKDLYARADEAGELTRLGEARRKRPVGGGCLGF